MQELARLLKADKPPFVINFCPWHPTQMQNLEYDATVVAYAKRVLSMLIYTAFEHSDQKIGYAVGQGVVEHLLPKLGYRDVTDKIADFADEETRDYIINRLNARLMSDHFNVFICPYTK